MGNPRSLSCWIVLNFLKSSCHYYFYGVMGLWLVAYLVIWRASWFIELMRAPSWALDKSWKLQVFFLWLVPLDRIWSLVPIKYLLSSCASGCKRMLSFAIADLSGIWLECTNGSIAGHWMFLVGSLLEQGFSKHPPVSPYASLASVGNRWPMCWTSVQGSSQMADGNKMN